MSAACKTCRTPIDGDDEDLCQQCKARGMPYYERFVKFPDLPRPNEPCNDFEHAVRWALVAYWEKARADRAENAPPFLPQLLSTLGWQGGTIHQALEEVKRLKFLSDTVTTAARHVSGVQAPGAEGEKP